MMYNERNNRNNETVTFSTFSRSFSIGKISEDMRTSTIFYKMFGNQPLKKSNIPDAKGLRPEQLRKRAIAELRKIIGDSFENHNCFVARRIDDVLDEKNGKLEVSPEKSESLEKSKSSELEFTKFQLKYGLNSGEKEVILDENRDLSFTSNFHVFPIKVK